MRIENNPRYFCEYCGEEFENEHLCVHHENLEKLLKECRFWDSDGNKIEGKNLLDSPADVWYTYIPTSTHRVAVNAWFSNHEYAEIDNELYLSGMFYCDNDWISIVNLKNLLEKMERMLDDAD